MFRGWRQNLPAVTPDPVQFDFELRVIECLERLPIELTCRAHPEGIFQGKIHPLAATTSLSERTFEELIDTCDIFVMDYCRSTTFWTALCSDRPIVMIETGYSYLDDLFTDEIRPLMERRVRFVRARNDDRNRLVIDEKELADAILSAPERVVSPELQTLLMGETKSTGP